MVCSFQSPAPTSSRSNAIHPLGALLDPLYNSADPYQHHNNNNHNNNNNMVHLSSEGRPVHAHIAEWRTAGHTPFSVQSYTQDARERPLRVYTPDSRSPHTVAIRNTGPMEFPVHDHSTFGTGNGRIQGGSLRTYSNVFHPENHENDWSIIMHQMGQVIDGDGSVAAFPVPGHVDQVRLCIGSDGYDVSAKIEVLQGPNCVKQEFEVQSENGLTKPFLAIIDTPGDSGHSIRIENTGPMTYPIRASVEPVPTDPFPETRTTDWANGNSRNRYDNSRRPDSRHVYDRQPLLFQQQQQRLRDLQGSSYSSNPSDRHRILPDPAQPSMSRETFSFGNRREVPSYMRPSLPESSSMPLPDPMQMWQQQQQQQQRAYRSRS